MDLKKFNLNSFYGIILIYGVVITGLVVYIFNLQKFGTKGMEFNMGGQDFIFSILDVAIIITTIVALFLLVISLLAFKKKRDMKLFLISIAFFFFAIKEVLVVFENFFPNEYIFIDNASRGLELLTLISFILLLYRK